MNADSTPRAVRVHIEELRIEGLRPGDKDRFGAALRGELSRLLTTRGLPGRVVRGGNSDWIDGGEIQTGAGLATSGAVRSVAISTARAIYSNLGNGRKI
ncbi:MAG: hypothetical protein RIF32_08630 [Leptospirales bacterium]|jgi:hypothetical protein